MLLIGCSTFKATQWQQSTLYFGLSLPNNSQVSTEKWQEFVNDQITPRFPDGLTIVDAKGQWKNSSGVIVKEPSKMVIILHPAENKINSKLTEIRQQYKEKFHQESVLLTTQSIKVDF